MDIWLSILVKADFFMDSFLYVWSKYYWCRFLSVEPHYVVRYFIKDLLKV